MTPAASLPISPLDAHTGFWLRFVSNHVSGEFQKTVEGLGVSVSEWVALRTLHGAQAPTHASLVAALGMTKGAVSKVVSRLQDKGLVKRVADPADARAQMLALTRKGHALLPRLARLADENDARFFGQLPAAEHQQLVALLQSIAAHHQFKQVPVA